MRYHVVADIAEKTKEMASVADSRSDIDGNVLWAVMVVREQIRAGAIGRQDGSR